MVKKLIQVFPYLLLTMVITTIAAVLDGYVTRKMMSTLDFAIKGDVEKNKTACTGTFVNGIGAGAIRDSNSPDQ